MAGIIETQVVYVTCQKDPRWEVAESRFEALLTLETTLFNKLVGPGVQPYCESFSPFSAFPLFRRTVVGD